MRKARVAFLILALCLTASACKKAKVRIVSIPKYTITASEPSNGKYAFNIPTGIMGGVITLELKNEGKEPHDFQLAKATPGHTLQEIIAGLGIDTAPLEEWFEAAGGVGHAMPGQTSTATLNLPAGTYWFFCTESNDEGKTSIAHGKNGMSGELTLTGDSGAKMPTAAASVAGRDYAFDITGLKAGSNSATFTNTGQQLHHALVVPIVKGKTFEEAKAALTSNSPPQGPPPIAFEKATFTPVIDPGQTIVVTFELEAGTDYVFACFMPDKGTAGPPHATKGMIAEANIA